tara:strand:- start:408 stop:569 length:162 start_codon:yes stop_codon:yes gene_type:complete
MEVNAAIIRNFNANRLFPKGGINVLFPRVSWLNDMAICINHRAVPTHRDGSIA